MLPDLRYAVRTLRRSPVFPLVAVMSLALGIGANTAIFSLIDAVLVKSLPVHNPDDLRTIIPINRRGEPGGVAYPLYRRFREDRQVFASVYAATGTSEMEMNGPRTGTTSERVVVQQVSGEYFPLLGVSAAAGLR